MNTCTWTEQLQQLPSNQKRKMISSDGVEFEIGSLSADLGDMKYLYFDGVNGFKFCVRHKLRRYEEAATLYPLEIIAADPPMNWFHPSRKIFEQNIELFFQSSHPFLPGTDPEVAKPELVEFFGPTFTKFSWCLPSYKLF